MDNLEKIRRREKDTIEDGSVMVSEDTKYMDSRYSGDKELKKVTLPEGLTEIGYHAFYGCSKLKSINLPDSTEILGEECFTSTAIKELTGKGVREMHMIFGENKKHEKIIPSAFPKITLSKVSNKNYKYCLVMGYLLHKELYTARTAASYEKYIEQNKADLIATAQRRKLTAVLPLLSEGMTDQEVSVAVASENKFIMPLPQAKELFDLQLKKTGYKICRYLGTETVVTIPDVIGRSAVLFVKYGAFPRGVVVHCNEAVYKKLDYHAQCSTYQAYISDTFQFSDMQQKFMRDHVKKNLVGYLQASIEDGNHELFRALLPESLNSDVFESLLKLAYDLGNAEFAALLIEKTQREDNGFDFQEPTLADLRKEFSVYQWKNEFYKDLQYAIGKQKGKNETISIPAKVDGVPVVLAGKAFYWDEHLKTITFQHGLQYIGELTCRHCPYLEAAYIPESVIFIGELSFTECPKLTIYAPEGSYAANYAKENGIPLVLE